jgi:DNA-binding NarL/FixJ family response regulator
VSIAVAIVDDQAIVLAGLVKLIEAEPGMGVAGTAVDGLAAMALVRATGPDVVLMDVRMPGMDGIEATRRIVAEHPRARVLVLTTFDLDEYVFGALRAGASGFLLKDAEPDHLVASIKVAVSGDSLIAPAAVLRLVADHALSAPSSSPAAGEVEALTGREREVFDLVVRGLSNAEIAHRLFLAEATVKSHVAAMLAKLGVRDRVQAVVLAYESGLVQPGSRPGPAS